MKTYNISIKYKGQELGTWINVPKNLIKTVLKVTLGPMVDEITIREEKKEDLPPNYKLEVKDETLVITKEAK